MPARLLTYLLIVLSTFRTSLADDAKVKGEIETTFATMSRAVVAGDQKAYLANIDASEKRFLVEQTHWAAILETYKPAEFSMAIGEGGTFGDNRAEFPLVMSWRFENGLKDNWGMNAKGRTVKFPTIVLVKRDGRWLWQGEKWKEIAGQDGVCTVRFLAGSEKAAEDVMKAFPVAKTHVDTEFGRIVKEQQTIELFQSMDHLKATVFINQPDSYLGGWSEPGESIKFMDNYTRGVEGWTAAFAHEYAHVATWELGPKPHTMPWWAEEGVAELCAGKFRPGYAATLNKLIKGLAKAGKLPAWSEISDYLTTAQDLKRLAYTQGNHLMNLITARWQREGRNKWLYAMANGKTLEVATREVFGLEFAELDKQWQESLKATDPEAKPAPASPAEPAGVRDQLTAMLVEMRKTVAAADQLGYLSHVSRADAVFLKEQENWAKDLGRKAPESIEIVLDEEPLKVNGDGAAIGRLSMTWRMPEGRDRKIAFPARFVKSDNGWLYAGEQWNVHEGDRSRVMYEDEALKDVAAAVAEVLPDIRASVDEAFGFTNNEKVTKAVQQVKLYTSMRHLQHSIYLSYTDSLSGWNEPDESIKILARAGTGKDTLRILLSHEYGHVATFHLGPNASDAPWWMLEGIAEVSSEKYSRGGGGLDRMIKGWAKTGKLVDWKDLADFHGEAIKHSMNVYNQGHHMVSFIGKEFTRPKLNAWMKDLANGKSLEDATREVLGLSFDELDAKWRASLEEKKEEAPKPERQRE